MWRPLFRTTLVILVVFFAVQRAGFGQVSVNIPNAEGTVAEIATIPINVGDLTGQNVTSFQFTLSYNASILNVTGANNTGALTTGTDPIVNTGTPGEITVAWAAATPLTGSGVLVNLEIQYLQVGSSNLGFQAFEFNEGSPASSTSGGTITVNSGTTPSVGVNLPASSSGSVGSPVLVPVNVGNLSGLNVTSYSFTVSFNQAIVGIASTSTNGTLSQSGSVNVNTNTAGQITVNWNGGTALSGSGTLIDLIVDPVTAGSTPLTFSSFQFNSGEPLATLTNGNFTVSPNGSVLVSISSTLSGAQGTRLTIPLTIGDVTGKGVASFEMMLNYDPAVIRIDAVAQGGSLSAGTTADVNLDTPGQANIAWASTTPLTGQGILLNLQVSLLSIGSSNIAFSSFQFNEGTPPVTTLDGRVTVSAEAGAPFLQIIHNSSDAPAVDIYINNVKQVDALAYGSATAFLELDAPNVQVDVVADEAPDNSNPIKSSNVSLQEGQDYVGVINGLFAGSGKQAFDLVVKEAQQEANNANTVGLLTFQGSPDAPPINVYIVDDTPQFNRILTLAKNQGFGDAFLAAEFDPGVYNIEITQANGPSIGVYRADLSRTAGAALLFMLQGFINPIIGQPGLSVAVYAPDGRAIFLPVATDNEDEQGLPDGFQLRGNYPNPFNPTTSIQFDLPEAALVKIDVFDLLGRHVLSSPSQQFYAGNDQAAQLDASELASGTYVYRVVAEGHQQSYISSQTMTLLK